MSHSLALLHFANGLLGVRRRRADRIDHPLGLPFDMQKHQRSLRGFAGQRVIQPASVSSCLSKPYPALSPTAFSTCGAFNLPPAADP
jgi:hypothetical protein